MDTANPATPPTANFTAQPRKAPMSSRGVAVSLVAAFVVGGLLAGVIPFWALVLIGIVVGAAAHYVMDRYGFSALAAMLLIAIPGTGQIWQLRRGVRRNNRRQP